MKINLQNPYGYKLCCANKNEKHYKIIVITNTYDLAKFEKERHLKMQNKKEKFNWFILPIKKKEYYKLWKDCPF